MKLVKTNNDYELFDSEELIASTKNKEVSDINFEILKEEDCKTIGWVDIDKLAEHSSEVQEGTYTVQHKTTYKHGFQDGFKTAQSLNDKMFSLEDMRNMLEEGIAWWGHQRDTDLRNSEDFFERYTKSLQQTVWNVEIEMECGEIRQCECIDNSYCLKPQPKITNNSIKVIKLL